MSRNLPKTPSRDVVQRTLSFEPRIGSFNGLSLGVQRFPSNSFLPYTEPLYQFRMAAVDHDYGFGPVLASDQSEQVFPRVTSVGHDISRMELLGG